MATPEQIQQVRYELADTDVGFPMLSDQEYTYFIDKNNSSIRRAMIDAAKSILFKLSMRGDEIVDIFSVKGSKAAEQYRMALQLFIKNPDFNPALTLAKAYAGGISKQDMRENILNEDNNAVLVPTDPKTYADNYFEVPE
jgi:hypothetical protein